VLYEYDLPRRLPEIGAMPKHSALDESLVRFIEAQHVFFVATAPLSADGHINLSPKGLDSLRLLGPQRVAYLDLVGSGVETVSHLRENGRIILMFCAFEGPPRIVRLHGRGRAVEPEDLTWADLAARFPQSVAARSIVVVDVERVSSSCGYGVPQYRYEGEREQMGQWSERKGEEGLRQYKAEHNRASIDGLPGLRLGQPVP
jgi:pyridoxamine 5'-phosphate oxidase-like protein